MILGKDESRTLLLAPLEESIEFNMPEQSSESNRRFRTLAESEDGQAIEINSIPAIGISDSMNALVKNRNKNPSLPDLSH